MFIFDVEVTKILIQSFGLEHHLDFQNTIIASGKTDQKKKKIIPGDNLWETQLRTIFNFLVNNGTSY